MDKDKFIEEVEIFMIESFQESGLPKTIINGMIRHLIQTRKYLLELTKDSQRDTTALEAAAVLHGIERAFRKNKKYEKMLEGKPHEERSAIIAENFLNKIKVKKKLAKKIVNLILKHETAPTKESKILREADNLSFLENTLPIWFEACLWMGQPRKEIIESSKKIVEKKFKQIKSKRGKELAKPYYKKWKNWLEQKEV